MKIKNIVFQIIAYKQSHPEKGALQRKILNILHKEILDAYVSFLYIFSKKNFNKEQSNRILNWKWYVYLKRKYCKILNSFQNPEVLKNEFVPKVIWWCWLQGEENAPSLCRACLNSIRFNMPDYEVKIVTEKNMWSLISVPPYIKQKYEKGIIPRTQFSDILRTCLLIEHGGIWMDSTVLVTGNIPNGILKKPLFFFQNFGRGDEAICLSNWFISAEKEEPSLCYIRDLLLLYWKENNFLCHYFIYHLFFTMVCEKFPQIIKAVPRYSNLPPHILQGELFDKFTEERWHEIKQMSAFHKLTYKFDTSNVDLSGTFYEHILQEFGKR